MEVDTIRLCRCLTAAVMVLALAGHASAGDVDAFVGVVGDSLTKNTSIPDDFSGGAVSSSFFLTNLKPSALVFHVSPVSVTPELDQFFFLSLVNNTGHDLQRIDARLGVLPSGGGVTTFSEGFGSFFGTIDPVLQPSFFFPSQQTDPANPTTHGGVLAPSWAAGLPGTLHFSASVLNTDHELAILLDVTPVPEPATGLILAIGLTVLMVGSSRCVKKPHRNTR